MQPLAAHLQQAGYAVVNVNYPSRRHSVEMLADMAVRQGIRQAPQTHTLHFVTHSLGGILLRQYLTTESCPRLGRVVMLGPPNGGSEVVDVLGRVPGFKWLNGPAGLQLGTDSQSVPQQLPAVDFEVGVIAGRRSINWLLSLLLPGANDGKVTVARTRVDGMQDHRVMPVTHPFMMRNPAVMQQVVSFLQQGNFE